MKLEDHPFFEQVDKDQVQELAQVAKVSEFPPDEMIFEQDSPSESLCLVLEGDVAFIKVLPDDKSRVVGYTHSGGFFGEVGLFTGEPRALRAESRGKVVLAEIPRNDLLEFIKKTPGPIDIILKSIIAHLHETTRHYMDDILRQEKIAMVGTMMNTIIHDFKNPFCLISLAAQLLGQMHQDPKSQKLCKNIDDQIIRMVAMAEEINSFSRGNTDLIFKEVRLTELLDRFEELNFPFFQNENVKIDVEIPDIVIDGEENKLIRIFQNLVGNAIDAFGEDQGKILIKGEQVEENELLLTISDNGKGIPEEIQARFFEPFVTYGKSKGTGLGTAIVKSIVEGHKGKIEFETGPEIGTTFTIRMPIRQDAAVTA